MPTSTTLTANLATGIVTLPLSSATQSITQTYSTNRAGKANFSPILVSLAFTDQLPNFYKLAAEGTHISQMTLTFNKQSAEGESVTYLKAILKNALISTIACNWSAEVPQLEMAFNFEQIELVTTELTESFDLSKNTLS